MRHIGVSAGLIAPICLHLESVIVGVVVFDVAAAQARRAVADLVGAADSRGVVFGPTMTALTYRFAAALQATWREGDEIVVTQLDHDANIRPWAQAARRAGVTVRTAAVDPQTAELPVEEMRALFGERTKLVALTAASNLVGTCPDVTAITSAAREVGAISFVDGVHHTPHAHVDLAALGADLYATSAYKWAGPHLAAVVAADPRLLQGLHPDQLLPSPDTVPERFELGTNPFASLAGVVAAVTHLSELDGAARGTQRERLAISRRAAGVHEDALGSRMLTGLAAIPKVTLYGRPSRRTPTAYFRLEGSAPAEVTEALSARWIDCWTLSPNSQPVGEERSGAVPVEVPPRLIGIACRRCQMSSAWMSAASSLSFGECSRAWWLQNSNSPPEGSTARTRAAAPHLSQRSEAVNSGRASVLVMASPSVRSSLRDQTGSNRLRYSCCTYHLAGLTRQL